MRDAAGQLAERVELLRLGELTLDFFQILLGLAALGNVARDLGEAEDIAVVVADRIDHDAGPEESAVLADAPTLLFVTAVIPRQLQGARRPARGLVGVGVEAGKMLADDFFR